MVLVRTLFFGGLKLSARELLIEENEMAAVLCWSSLLARTKHRFLSTVFCSSLLALTNLFLFVRVLVSNLGKHLKSLLVLFFSSGDDDDDESWVLRGSFSRFHWPI